MGRMRERWKMSDETRRRETRRVLYSTGSGGRKHDRGCSGLIVSPRLEWVGRRHRHHFGESVADVRISGTEALKTRRIRGVSLSILWRPFMN